MKTSHIFWGAALVLLPACFSPYLLPAVYLERAGVMTEGQVTAKRETVEMRRQDRWRQLLEVTYQYTPADTGIAETGSHQVAPALYDRLQPGSRVKVRYTPSRLLRSLHIQAMGSALADSTWVSRLPGEAGGGRVAFDIGAALFAALLGAIAWRTKTPAAIVAFAFCAATVCSAVFPFGFVAFPLLFAVWRKWPGHGLGWALAGSIVLSIPVLHARIPKPAPPPSGAAAQATAVVRQVQTADHIWSNWRDAGQSVPQAFQIADLEFTPEGMGAPIHAADSVDLNSVPELRVGANVRVVYPRSDPRSARIVAGTRTYPEKAFLFVLVSTFGFGILVMLLVIPAIALADRIWRRAPARLVEYSTRRIPREAIARKLATLPAGDPRREALEAFLAGSPNQTGVREGLERRNYGSSREPQK